MTTKKTEAPPTGDCIICDAMFTKGARTTDVPKIFRCPTCGAPLVKSKDGTLRSAILPDWVDPTRRLWKAAKVNVAPGYGFDPESNKDGDETERTKALIRAWFRKNRKTMPPSYATWGRDEDRRFD